MQYAALLVASLSGKRPSSTCGLFAFASLLLVAASSVQAQTVREVVPGVVRTDLPETKLFSPSPTPYTDFGSRIAADGDLLAVSALYETVNGRREAGAVYVYRLFAGAYALEARLIADTAASFAFGAGLDVVRRLDADYVFASSPDLRTVFVFRRAPGQAWTRVQRIEGGATFGDALSADGDRLAVAATYELPNGAVYVYERRGDAYARVARLTADDPIRYLGHALALSGDRLAVVTAGFTDNYRGAAYVFARGADGAWAFEAALPTPEAVWTRGAVAMDGSRVLVTASQDNTVYEFERADGLWRLSTPIRGLQSAADGCFGSSLELRGRYAFVGSPCDDERGFVAGAVHVYLRDDAAWTEVAKVIASDAGAANSGPYGFGGSIASTGRYLLADISARPERIYAFHLDALVTNASDEIVSALPSLSAAPNPFANDVRLDYVLDAPAHVRVRVLDALGREVVCLVDGFQSAGTQRAAWRADGFPSGVYVVHLEAGRARASRPLVLVR